jgi:hypothetical protein
LHETSLHLCTEQPNKRCFKSPRVQLYQWSSNPIRRTVHREPSDPPHNQSSVQHVSSHSCVSSCPKARSEYSHGESRKRDRSRSTTMTGCHCQAALPIIRAGNILPACAGRPSGRCAPNRAPRRAAPVSQLARG